MRHFKEWFLVVESKQTITGMGFPEIIASLFFKKFGKNAPLIAKWYKQYHAYGHTAESPDWWNMAMTSLRGPSIADLTRLYYAANDKASYLKAAQYFDLDVDEDEIDDADLQNEKQKLAKQIEAFFFDASFFKSYSIIKDIESGNLKDLAPYKKLNFDQAQHKYEEKNVFSDTKPIKIYGDGFKWIDVGPKCHFLGRQMSNCGSVGLMSTDPNATIIALFGPNNKPHVMVTYAPNQKKISGDQGAGSTAIKDKYHDYVLDLTKILGADLDAMNSKSKLLGIKFILKNKTNNIERVGNPDDQYNELYKFSIGTNVFYTNGYTVISDEDLQKAQQMIQTGQFRPSFTGDNIVSTALARANIERLHAMGVHYAPLVSMAN